MQFKFGVRETLMLRGVFLLLSAIEGTTALLGDTPEPHGAASVHGTQEDQVRTTCLSSCSSSMGSKEPLSSAGTRPRIRKVRSQFPAGPELNPFKWNMSLLLFLCPSLSLAAIVKGIARNRSPQQSYFCTLTISCSFHFGICALPSNPISGLLVNQAEGAFWVKQPRLLAGLTERLLSSCPEPRMHAPLDWNTTSSILCGARTGLQHE